MLPGGERVLGLSKCDQSVKASDKFRGLSPQTEPSVSRGVTSLARCTPRAAWSQMPFCWDGNEITSLIK